MANEYQLSYTGAEINQKLQKIDNCIPATRTVNGKALSSDITLNAADIGTYTKTEIDNLTASSGGSNDKYHTPTATSGIKIATGSGVNDLYVPTGTTSSTVAVGNHTHSNYAPAYSYGTTDLDPEEDSLTTGKLYFVYE